MSERLFVGSWVVVVVFGVSFISSSLLMLAYMMTLMAGFGVTRFGFKSFSLSCVPLCVFGFGLCAKDRLLAEYAKSGVLIV